MTIALHYHNSGSFVHGSNSTRDRKPSKKEKARQKLLISDSNNNVSPDYSLKPPISSTSKKRKIYREKIFISKPSLLTEMLHADQYACLYNIFLAIVINLSAYAILSDIFVNSGHMHNLGIFNVLAMFGKPLHTLLLLGAMHFSVYGPFYWSFRLWSDNRYSFLTASMESIWDLSFVMAFGLYIYAFYYVPLQIQFMDRLPLASATIIVMEQLRLTMKLYAFVRSNVPRVVNFCDAVADHENAANTANLSGKYNLAHLEKKEKYGAKLIPAIPEEEPETFQQHPHQQDFPPPRNPPKLLGENQLQKRSNKPTISGGIPALQSPAPDFSTFLYFLFAPTLIYRDSYPRTDKIRPYFLFTTILELLGCIYLYNLVHHLCGFTMIENFGLPGHIFTLSQILPYVFAQSIVGGLGCVLGFYVLLHASQNISSEILRFGDRQFYRDWWNSDSFGTFYRKWNVIVHDFLYTYIYKEASDARLDTIHKYFPAILVFVVSSLFHEYIFIFVLQFFYPVLLIFFGGFGMILCFIPNKSSWHMGNLFVWWSLITGCGLIHAFYTLEYFARKNGCPPASTPFLDFVIPRSWTCGIFQE